MEKRNRASDEVDREQRKKIKKRNRASDDVEMGQRKKMKKRNEASDYKHSRDRGWDFKEIMKDIELISASCMTWKERKQLENRKVVSLGGKPPKKQRLPLSVARVQMKKQKEREQKMLQMKEQENLILGRFRGKRAGGGGRRSVEKRKPEDRVLKASEGHFRNGILDVKHLLNAAPSRDDDSNNYMASKGKKMRSGKKNKGKMKGGGRKRH